MSTPTDFFSYKSKILSADGVSLDRIAEAVGTPAYVYSASAFLSPLLELQKGLKSIDHLVCFAVKANSNIGVLKMLHQAGRWNGSRLRWRAFSRSNRECR